MFKIFLAIIIIARIFVKAVENVIKVIVKIARVIFSRMKIKYKMNLKILKEDHRDI